MYTLKQSKISSASGFAIICQFSSAYLAIADESVLVVEPVFLNKLAGKVGKGNYLHKLSVSKVIAVLPFTYSLSAMQVYDRPLPELIRAPKPHLSHSLAVISHRWALLVFSSLPSPSPLRLTN